MTERFSDELKTALGSRAYLISKLDHECFNRLLEIAASATTQEYIEEGILDRLSLKYDMTEEQVDNYYIVVYTILKTILSLMPHEIEYNKFQKSLTEAKISHNCIDILYNTFNSVNSLKQSISVLQKPRFYSHLVSCKWRIDIIISSSVLNRVLEPCIIMEWIFDTGERQTFELSLAKFHQIRHAIATILVEMQSIEQQCISKNIQCN